MNVGPAVVAPAAGTSAPIGTKRVTVKNKRRRVPAGSDQRVNHV